MIWKNEYIALSLTTTFLRNLLKNRNADAALVVACCSTNIADGRRVAVRVISSAAPVAPNVSVKQNERIINITNAKNTITIIIRIGAEVTICNPSSPHRKHSFSLSSK